MKINIDKEKLADFKVINSLFPLEVKKEFDSYNVKIYCSNNEGTVYSDILNIRAKIYNKSISDVQFEEDQYSDLYCVYQNESPVATMCATRDTQGKLDCEDFYPKNLLCQFEGNVISASRYCSSGRTLGKSRMGLLLMRALMFDQAMNGVKLCIIGVRKGMIRYYLRHGFELVPQSDFVHPITGNHRVVMVLSNDVNRPSAFRDLFQHLKNDNVNS